jgi:hypothetical protein
MGRGFSSHRHTGALMPEFCIWRSQVHVHGDESRSSIDAVVLQARAECSRPPRCASFCRLVRSSDEISRDPPLALTQRGRRSCCLRGDPRFGRLCVASEARRPRSDRVVVAGARMAWNAERPASPRCRSSETPRRGRTCRTGELRSRLERQPDRARAAARQARISGPSVEREAGTTAVPSPGGLSTLKLPPSASTRS